MALFLLILIVALCAFPIIQDMRRRPVSEDERSKASGKIVDTPQGKTYVTWDGPSDGPVLIAIHGLTTPSYVFDAITPALAGMGYRVMRYDHIGRGLSDPLSTHQDQRFFLKHLDTLLTHEGIEDDLTLLGYSMGGSIAAAFASAQPGRIKQVILLAPAGIEINEAPFSRFARYVPLLGDWWMETYGRWKMQAALSAERQDRIEVGGVVDKQLDAFNRRGYLRAVLSSMRGMLADHQHEVHTSIAKADIPVAAIWGETDSVIPLKGLGTLAQWNRAAKHETIKGAGHGLAYSHPNDVAGAIRKLVK